MKRRAVLSPHAKHIIIKTDLFITYSPWVLVEQDFSASPLSSLLNTMELSHYNGLEGFAEDFRHYCVVSKHCITAL